MDPHRVVPSGKNFDLNISLINQHNHPANLIHSAMKNLAIIGTGITGLSTANLLKSKFEVTLFEKSSKPGGLIKCDRINDNLFHRVGGHVFNSSNQQVLDWFWDFFDREKEFTKAQRNAKILLNNEILGYPIENHFHELESSVVSNIIDDLLAIVKSEAPKVPGDYPHFEAFLVGNFGPTLYNLYFEPYNRKIWNADLAEVPLAWLEGKLPMPEPKQILLSNILKQEEGEMVHSTFYYPLENGSQFIVDRLAQGLDIRLNSPVTLIEVKSENLSVNGETFAKVVYTGDVRCLKNILVGIDSHILDILDRVNDLPSNGTSNVFCECDPTDTSWLYLSDPGLAAHRIIYTGAFAKSNNRGSDRMTCVVEFSGSHEESFMAKQLKLLPGNLKPLAFNYEPNSYVLQKPDSRQLIKELKEALLTTGIRLVGRFAEWEYYNMDKAIEAAMGASQDILNLQLSPF